jgi:hypothetical protein
MPSALMSGSWEIVHLGSSNIQLLQTATEIWVFFEHVHLEECSLLCLAPLGSVGKGSHKAAYVVKGRKEVSL